MSLSAESKRKDNTRIPLYFLYAFLVVFAVNGLFVYLALSTHNGVVAENHYEKGLDYNRIVQEVRQLNAGGANGTGAP